MDKVYAIFWGFNSQLDSEENLLAVCTSIDIARKIVKEDELSMYKKLEETSENHWTDGDYWIYIQEIKLNTVFMYGYCF